MSHFVSIPLTQAYTNQEVLVKALAELGFQNIQSHSEKVSIRDYYQIRKRKAASRSQAEIVIPFENNQLSSDVGFMKDQKEEFQLVADSMDRHHLNNKLRNLPQVYTAFQTEEILATITASANNQTQKGKPIIEQKTLPNGEIQISVAWENEIAATNQVIQQQYY